MELRKCMAETIGIFWFTFAGCGSAVIPAPGVGVPQVLEATEAELVVAPELVGQIAPPPPFALSLMEVPNVA